VGAVFESVESSVRFVGSLARLLVAEQCMVCRRLSSVGRKVDNAGRAVCSSYHTVVVIRGITNSASLSDHAAVFFLLSRDAMLARYGCPSVASRPSVVSSQTSSKVNRKK